MVNADENPTVTNDITNTNVTTMSLLPATDVERFNLKDFIRPLKYYQRRYFLALAMGYNEKQAGRLSGVLWKQRSRWLKAHPEWEGVEKRLQVEWPQLALEAFQLWTEEYKIEAFEKLMDIALARREVPVKEQLLALQFYFRMFVSRDVNVDDGTILEKFAFSAVRRVPYGGQG